MDPPDNGGEKARPFINRITYTSTKEVLISILETEVITKPKKINYDCISYQTSIKFCS